MEVSARPVSRDVSRGGYIFYISKGWVVAACAAIQISGGSDSYFAFVAPKVKEALHLDENQLQGIVSASLTTGFFAFIPGVVFDRLQQKEQWGPRVVGLFGGLLTSLGFSLAWASFRGMISSSYWVLILEQILLCHGLVWLDTASLATAALTFPLHQGSVGGLLKAFYGVGGSLLAEIFAAFERMQNTDLTIFIAIAILIITVVAVPFLNTVPWKERIESLGAPKRHLIQWRLLTSCGLLVLLLVYQLACGLSTMDVPPDSTIHYVLLAGSVILTGMALGYLALGSGSLWSYPLSVAQISTSVPGSSLTTQPEMSVVSAESISSSIESPLLTSTRNGSEDFSSESKFSTATCIDIFPDTVIVRNKAELPMIGSDHSLAQTLASLDFWLLMWAMSVGSSTGYVFTVNLGLQVPSLGGRQGQQGVYVLLVAACNVLGRILVGFGSDFLLLKFSFPRTAIMTALAAVNVFVLLLAALGNLKSLLLCACLEGLVLGGHWSLMPAFTSDLFGTKSFASILGLIHLANSAGDIAMNSGIVGPLYQHASQRAAREGLCKGQACFRTSYCIMAGLSALAAAASLWLQLRTASAYNRLQANWRT